MGSPLPDPPAPSHTRHDRIVSDRASVQTIGYTNEHRPMPVLTITSPANLSRLEEIRVAHMAATESTRPPVERVATRTSPA